MKFLWKSLSLAVILSVTACSTTNSVSTPVAAAAKNGVTQNPSANLTLNEKDFKFTAPVGFQGPRTMSKEKYSKLSAFTSTEEQGTVITVHSGYSKTPLWDPGANMQKSIVKKYLTRMISGIENRRTNYKQSDIEFQEINGIQMGKISWTGDTESGPMQGTMYSFLKSGNNHTISVQGFTHSTTSINKAYDAVENINIGK